MSTLTQVTFRSPRTLHSLLYILEQLVLCLLNVPCVFFLGKQPKHSVLAICDEWFSSKGGMSTFSRTLCASLAKEDTVEKVAVLLTDDENLLAKETEHAQKLNVDLISAEEDILSAVKPTIVLCHQGVPDTGELLFLRSLLDKNKIRYKTAHILHAHPQSLEREKNPAGAANKADNKELEQLRLAKQADVVAAVGPLLQDLWQGPIGREVKVVCLDPSPSVETTAIPSTSPNLAATRRCLFMSRLDTPEAMQSKGLYIALEAMKLYGKYLERVPDGHDARFVIRGFKDGDEADAFVSKHEKSLGKKVMIDAKPFIKNMTVIRDEFKGADVFLMPSKHEGFGLVALESLSVGTPVIVSKKQRFCHGLEVREIRRREKMPRTVDCEYRQRHI